MYRQVLTNQFHLTAHAETKQLPVYVVTVAKGGPKFKPHVPDPAHPERENGSGWFSWSRGKLVAQGPTMPYFLYALSLELRHSFVDKTGLSGNYDFSLEWAPDDLAAPAQGSNDGAQPVAGDSAPSIFTAIQEQLGLKLESTKGPVQVMVVDNVTRPTADVSNQRSCTMPSFGLVMCGNRCPAKQAWPYVCSAHPLDPGSGCTASLRKTTRMWSSSVSDNPLNKLAYIGCISVPA